jgi:acetolactate decarboxylase
MSNKIFGKHGVEVAFTLLITITMTTALLGQAVQHRGAARNVMMGIDLSATVQLDSLLQRPHMFGLGPVDDLQGEITIINGQVYVSSVGLDGSLYHRSDSSVRAPFLAFAFVENWIMEEVSLDLQDWEALQNWVTISLQKRGLPPNQAFPFRLEGSADYVNYHVIRRDLSKKEHNHDLHHQSKVHFEWEAKNVQILGFYSTQHEGVFTHKGQFMHVHVVDIGTGANGHLDDIRLKGVFKVYWPDIQ